MAAGIINYFLVLAILIFGLVFYHNYVMLVLLIIGILIPFFTGIYTYIVSKKLKISLNIEQKSVAREHNVEVDINIDNDTLFSLDNVEVKLKIYNTFYGNDETITLIVPATAKKKRTIKWNFSSKYAGRIIVNIQSIKVKDIINIFTFNCDAKSDAEIIIMPEIKKIDAKLEVISEGDGEQAEVQYKKGSDVSEISEIREYIPGDKLQMIHWKISAKQDKMMVKEYSMPYTNEFILIPEMYYDGKNPKELDDIIDMLYSYAHRFCVERRQFYIGWLNGRTGEVFSSKVESEEDILMIITQLFYSELEKQPNQAREYFSSIGKYEGKTVVYIGKAVVTCLS